MAETGAWLAHEAPDVPGWQESIFLAWSDPASGLFGVHRIGHEPDRAVANVWCGVRAPDGTSIRVDLDALPLAPGDHAVRFTGGEHTFTAGDGLRLTVDGADLQLDLQMQDFFPATGIWDHTEDVMVARETIADHLEASGRVRGTVTVEGRTHAVDGLAHRDHSWGPRDWSRIHSHCWVAGTTGPGLSFSCIVMQGADGSFLRGAGVVRDGVVSTTKDVDILIRMEADGISHRGGTVVLRLPDGEVLELECEALDGFVFDQREHVEVDTICAVRVSTGEVGFCDFEVSQGLRRPVRAALRAVVAPGTTRRGPVPAAGPGAPAPSSR